MAVPFAIGTPIERERERERAGSRRNVHLNPRQCRIPLYIRVLSLSLFLCIKRMYIRLTHDRVRRAATSSNNVY